MLAWPYLSEIYLPVLPWLFPSVPRSRVLLFLCPHQLARFASLNYLSYSCILSREPQAGRLEKCQGPFLSQVCSCVQVFTQVMTQGGRQYQVAVLVLVPPIFVILLEGRTLVDPGEIREGIFRDWWQSPHTRRWKSHG